MLSTFTFAAEMVICFVLVDFALDQRWGAVVLGLGVGLAAYSMLGEGGLRAAAKRQEEQKQGAYGKVVVLKQPLWAQLMHLREVWAMVRCKFLGGMKGDFRLDANLESWQMNTDDVAFCATKLKEVSRSFATVITFLPSSEQAPLRLAVAVFYLVLRALDTVEDEMDLALFERFVTPQDSAAAERSGEDARLVAKQRLLRDFAARLRDEAAASSSASRTSHQPLAGLGHGSERELVEQMDALVRVLAALPKALQDVILDITTEMGEGMAFYIARDLKNGTEDAEDFERYCHVAAGTVGDGLTRLFAVCGLCEPGLERKKDLWDPMGSFLQRTNIIRDYLEDLVDGRAWWPRSVWAQYAVAEQPPALSALAQSSCVATRPGGSVGCLNHMVADALEMVQACLEYLDGLPDVRVLSFCALPQVMAMATLAECFENPQVFRGVVKIRKGQAARIMLDLKPRPGMALRDMRKAYLRWYVKCARQMIARASKGEARDDPQAQRAAQACVRIEEMAQQRMA